MRNEPSFPAAAALAEEYAMFPRGSTILAAVSGGRDSMAMLHWLHRTAPHWGVTLAVGHYHHGLRGAQADADLERVQLWCEAHAIPFYWERGAVADEAARRALGVEETGRLLRYAFLEGLTDRLGAEAIATAHNADDNAETLLLHLLRGTGLQGLTGIPPRRGRVVRPLLTTSRAAIDTYVAAWQVPYGDDGTNTDETFARNRLRHQVTPVLQSLNPRYVETVGESIALLRRDNDFLNELAEQLVAEVQESESSLCLPAAALAQAPLPVASRAARLLLVRVSGSHTFRQAHIQAVLDTAASTDPSARADLPHGLRVWRQYDQLCLSTTAPVCGVVERPLSPGRTLIGAWQIWVEGEATGLVVRARRVGDEVRLPGQRRKPLKKLLIERKIPRAQRDSLPIVADQDGILAVAGLGINTDHPRAGERIVKIEKQEKE